MNEELVIELKSVERILPIHKAQALTYLRLTGLPQAFVINFCVPVLRHGITSVGTPKPLVSSLSSFMPRVPEKNVP